MTNEEVGQRVITVLLRKLNARSERPVVITHKELLDVTQFNFEITRKKDVFHLYLPWIPTDPEGWRALEVTAHVKGTANGAHSSSFDKLKKKVTQLWKRFHDSDSKRYADPIATLK